jgi:hypothetical protein
MKSFKDYYIGTLLRPGKTFDILLTDNRRLKLGFLAMLINVLLYTFVYIFLTIGGGAPTIAPWLAIPKDVYYFYDRFILAPSLFGLWILAAGVAYLLSRLFSGKGSFDDTLSVFGFGITIAYLFSLLHDFPDSLLGAIGLLDLRWYEVQLNTPTIWRTILFTFYSIGLIVLALQLSIGVEKSQRIKRGPAILIGTISFIVFQGGFFIFNR